MLYVPRTRATRKKQGTQTLTRQAPAHIHVQTLQGSCGTAVLAYAYVPFSC